MTKEQIIRYKRQIELRRLLKSMRNNQKTRVRWRNVNPKFVRKYKDGEGRPGMSTEETKLARYLKYGQPKPLSRQAVRKFFFVLDKIQDFILAEKFSPISPEKTIAKVQK